jgi:hypothetical protein
LRLSYDWYAIERKAIEETLLAEHERDCITLDSIGDAVISVDISEMSSF